MLNQLRYFAKYFASPFSVQARPLHTLEHLNKRQLIRISGGDSLFFLQGLVTNDMRHLEDGIGALYAMFLNTKGRVLYDTIIYKTLENDTFFLECDTDIASDLEKHLKLYRVRRKVDIANLRNDYQIHVLYNLDALERPDSILNDPDKETTKIVNNVTLYRDPRLHLLGHRIITEKDVDVFNDIEKMYALDKPENNTNYRWFRYKLGIGEGIIDLPPNKCFPLESNGDYLHGISFHKGCYIGQELTARSYHTGVIRKRLLPFTLDDKLRQLPEDTKIFIDKTNIGVWRGVEGDVGLALMRFEKALEVKKFLIENRFATPIKPTWWPLEAPKEKMTA